MDNRFKATRFVRALAQSQRVPEDSNGFNDRLLIVLLDEMNLARIELYFSDLLSQLEFRRGSEKETWIRVDLGSGEREYKIPLGRNVLFAGTMNEDETTHTLSDKVIDRTNLIAFPRPRILQSRDTLTLADERGFLPYPTWKKWLETPAVLDSAIRVEYRRAMEEINGRLAHTGRALGHRVWQAVESYIANHPYTRQAAQENDPTQLKNACRLAFEDQLVQKIMPKLRGLELDRTNRNACLDPIAEIIHEHANGLTEDFRQALESGHGTFEWRGAAYLERDV